jgi:hypothetical protein
MTEDEYFEEVMNGNAPNPIRQYKDGWYFWDEAWCDKYGPYKTKIEAQLALNKYIKDYL